MALLEEAASLIAGLTLRFDSADAVLGRIVESGPPIRLAVRGQDLSTVESATESVAAALRLVPEVFNVGTSFENRRAEVRLTIDRPVAAGMGLSPDEIGRQLRQYLGAESATTFRVDTPLYLSTDYSDPFQLSFDPPITHGTGTSQADIEARSYLFCSKYDNGSTPTSPSIKRQSTSPEPPLPIGIGGPCDDSDVRCANDGPNKGVLCNADDAFCDSSVGAGDGDCDACVLTGGVTTADEMFILIGSYFIP